MRDLLKIWTNREGLGLRMCVCVVCVDLHLSFTHTVDKNLDHADGGVYLVVYRVWKRDQKFLIYLKTTIDWQPKKEKYDERKSNGKSSQMMCD